MRRTGKSTKRASERKSSRASHKHKSLKSKNVSATAAHAEAVRQMVDPQFEQQLKLYEQAAQHFHQQKYAKAKELIENAICRPSKATADRGQEHLRITEQRTPKQ